MASLAHAYGPKTPFYWAQRSVWRKSLLKGLPAVRFRPFSPLFSHTPIPHFFAG